nr:hypothetical protein [Tanacetum cinerariifolium]
MEEIDLRWHIAMLTMRGKRFLKKTRKKSFKKSRQQAQGKHKKECACGTPTSIDLVSCDGLGGYDWSDQAEEGPNYALIAYTSSSSDSKKYELIVLAYKTGLKLVEERLEFFNEFIYLEDIKVLKVEIQMKDIANGELRRKLKVAQKEKDGIQLTIEKLENAAKSLNKLIDCQIVENFKKGLRYKNYNAVPSSFIENFIPPKLDLTYTGLDEFAVKPIVENKSSEEETKVVRKNNDAPFIEEWVSNNEEKNLPQTQIVKKIVRPSILKKEFVKLRQQEKTARKTIKKVEHNRQNTHMPRGNQRN